MREWYFERNKKKEIKKEMIEILTNRGDDTLHNTINLLEGKVFEQEKNGFKPFPPGIYFSENIPFMKSMVNHYSNIRYKTAQELRDITINDFWKYLYDRTTDEGNLRKKLQKEYLVEYENKFKNHGKYKLIVLISDMNIDRVHFIYKGMYLFRIIPEYFIRFK